MKLLTPIARTFPSASSVSSARYAVHGPVESRGRAWCRISRSIRSTPSLPALLSNAVQGLVVAVVADPDLGLEERRGAPDSAHGLADLPLVAVRGGGVDVPVAGRRRPRRRSGSSSGGVWNTPRPMGGISTPLFRGVPGGSPSRRSESWRSVPRLVASQALSSASWASIDGADGAQRVRAEQEQRRRLVGLDGGDDRLRGPGGVAGLGAVRGVVLLAALAGGLGVVVDDGGGLLQRAAGEVGPERARLDDGDGDAERRELLAQGAGQALERGLGGGVVARSRAGRSARRWRRC